MKTRAARIYQRGDGKFGFGIIEAGRRDYYSEYDIPAGFATADDAAEYVRHEWSVSGVYIGSDPNALARLAAMQAEQAEAEAIQYQD